MTTPDGETWEVDIHVLGRDFFLALEITIDQAAHRVVLASDDEHGPR
jgi:hypothetical protein